MCKVTFSCCLCLFDFTHHVRRHIEPRVTVFSIGHHHLTQPRSRVARLPHPRLVFADKFFFVGLQHGVVCGVPSLNTVRVPSNEAASNVIGTNN